MLDLKQSLWGFMDVMIDSVISDLEKKKREYKMCKKEELDNVNKFDEVVDRIPKEDRDFIKKHEINVFNIAVSKQSYIYC